MKKMVEKFGLAGGIGALSVFLTASIVKAQTLCDPLGTNCTPGTESFTSVATNVTTFLVTDIAIPLSIIMVLVGAFQFMTGGGDPEKISQARKTILYAAVGLAVALLAGGVATLIKNIIGGS